MTELQNALPENEILSPKEIAFMGYLRACNDLKTKDGSLEKGGREYNLLLERCGTMDKVSANIIQMIFGKLDAGDVSALDPKRDGSKISGLKQSYFNEDKFEEIIRLADMAIDQSEMEYPGVPAVTLAGINDLKKVFADFKPVYEAYLKTLEEDEKNKAIASVQSNVDRHDRSIARFQGEIAFHEKLKAKRLEEIAAITGKTQERVAEVTEVGPEKETLAKKLGKIGKAGKITEKLGTKKEAPVSTPRPEAEPKQKAV